MVNGSTLSGAFMQDESWAGNGGDGYASLTIDADSKWIVTGDSTLTTLNQEGAVTDASGRTVTVKKTDGTVCVEGDSDYTVTVENYTTQADCSNASRCADWEDYAVEEM